MTKKQNLSDTILIKQYLKGNNFALSILVKRHHKTFCKKAYWITKDKDLAKDIAQEAWIAIIHKLYKLENIDRFKGWAHRIIYTKAVDAVKKRNKANQDLKNKINILPDTSTLNGDNELVKTALLKAIKELPRQKQDIIRLFYSEEYSIAEISSFLKIPIGTVKSRLFKAREKLKSIVKLVNNDK